MGVTVQLFNNPVAMLFLSFIAGLIGDALLRRFAFYQSLSRLYLFSDSKIYERLGVLWFRKFLLATPLRLFNNKIFVAQKRDLNKLKEVRAHIATAEGSHWVAFFLMLIAMLPAWWYFGWRIGASYLALNIAGNLYPCLLQQVNKRRLNAVISVLEKRS